MKLLPQFVLDILMPWSSQVLQYDPTGEPGLSHFLGDMPGDLPPVDCLLWRDDDGTLIGVLTYYSVDYYESDGTLLDAAGNFTVLVHPDKRRQGIGRKLLSEAERRWKLNFDQQIYTPSGLALVRSLGHWPQ